MIEGVGRVVYFTPGASSAVENTSPTGTAAVAWMPTEMRKSVTFSKWGGYVAITIPKPTIVPPRRHVKFGDAFRTFLSRRTEVEMAPRPLPSTRSKHTSRSCRAAESGASLYSRVPKTGSTALLTAAQNSRCRGWSQMTHSRSMFEVKAGLHPQLPRVAVLREPCDRFASQFWHLSRRARAGARPNATANHAWLGNVSARLLAGATSPDAWLLHLVRVFGRFRDDPAAMVGAMGIAISAAGHGDSPVTQLGPAAPYYDARTCFVCYETRVSQAILARFCGVPTNLTGNARLPSTSQPRLTTAGCKDLRSELLPVDAKLWASICGGAGAG